VAAVDALTLRHDGDRLRSIGSISYNRM
jgi:hypothetical protein